MTSRTATFSDLLIAVAGWALAVCAAWAALIVLAALVEAATGGRWRATTWVGCPPALRRTLLALLGVALASAPAQVSAQVTASALGAGSGAGSGAATGVRRSPPELALPVPSRPSGGLRAGHPVVVRPGDSLWRLAAARLPSTATAAEVCALVERLHADNRDVIGPDPDLIRPGQRLVAPPEHPS